VTSVVLVRPWSDARAGGGCCGGGTREGVCLERSPAACPADSPESHAKAAHDPVATAWRELRAARPELDVQLVNAGNTAFLLPFAFRSVRRRAGVVAGLRAAARATTAGAVLVDGERVGTLDELGVDGLLDLLPPGR